MSGYVMKLGSLLGDDASSIIERRKRVVADMLHSARACAMAELGENDALTEVLTRALRTLGAGLYKGTFLQRGDIGRDETITTCERALRAFYEIQLIEDSR